MRKYLQILIVLTIFGFFVFLKQVNGSDILPSIAVTVKLISPLDKANPSSTPIKNTPVPTVSSVSTPMPSALTSSKASTPVPASVVTPKPQGQYKDGSYTGSVADAFYGNIQVQAVISGGKLADVIFLQYPGDNGTSQSINSQAMPLLKQEAIQAQSAKVDIVSGASASSQAFQQSLADALTQAK